jgi:uncharacterized protein DUF998
VNEFRQRLAVWSGMIGALLFLAVFIAEDFFSPDFNWLSTAVSEHSLTPHGWIQITTFIVVGLLFVIFSGGIAEGLRNVPGSRTGPLMIRITGVCLILSGPLVTDPGGVVMGSSGATWHGAVHGIVGAIAFTLMPLSCFVFYRHLRSQPAWSSFARWSLTACFIIIFGIVLLKLAQLGVMRGLLGLFQRVLLVAYFGWIFALALRLNASRPDSVLQRAQTMATSSTRA